MEQEEGEERQKKKDGWVGGYTGGQQQNVVNNNYDAYIVTELHIKSATSSRGIHSSSFNIVKCCVGCAAP